jgi:hypothetical protein
MDDKATPSPSRLNTAQYADLLERGLNPTVHDAEGNFIPPKPMIDASDTGTSGSKKKQPTIGEELRSEKIKGRDEGTPLLDMLNIATSVGLLRAAEHIYDKFHQAWTVEKFRRDNEVVQAAINKTPVGDKYYLAEYVAQKKMELAQKVMLAIKEEVDAKQGGNTTQGT